MSTFVPLPAFASVAHEFAACTLVLPLFSVGNVGCLAVDALLATHAATLVHVGYLDAMRLRVQCAVGNDALATAPADVCGRLHLPLEVFFAAEAHLVVVQQRAPVIQSGRRDFADAMLEWVVSAQFARVMTLSSCAASARVDAQIDGAQFRYFVSSLDSEWHSLAQRLQLPAMEVVPSAFGDDNDARDAAATASALVAQADDVDDDSNFPLARRVRRQPLPTCASPAAAAIPGSHVLRMLYERARERAVPVLGLVYFATDAAGAADGIALVRVADAVLNASGNALGGSGGSLSSDKTYKTPLTWHSMDAEPVVDELYI